MPETDATLCLFRHSMLYNYSMEEDQCSSPNRFWLEVVLSSRDIIGLPTCRNFSCLTSYEPSVENLFRVKEKAHDKKSKDKGQGNRDLDLPLEVIHDLKHQFIYKITRNIFLL